MRERWFRAIVLVAGLLLFTSLASSQSTLPVGVNEVTDCKTVTWQEQVDIVENCAKPYFETVCSDYPINQSCTEELRHYTIPCITGTQTINKSKQECKTTALTIADKIKLNIKDYACTVTKAQNEYEAICDSKYDGNGDGICTSGESCQKFVIQGDQVQQLVKNSQDTFTSTDDSFYLQKSGVEVLK